MSEENNNVMENATGFETEDNSEEKDGTPIGYILAFGGLVFGGICYVGKKIFGKKKKYAEVHHGRFAKTDK